MPMLVKSAAGMGRVFPHAGTSRILRPHSSQLLVRMAEATAELVGQVAAIIRAAVAPVVAGVRRAAPAILAIRAIPVIRATLAAPIALPILGHPPRLLLAQTPVRMASLLCLFRPPAGLR